jgi:hypothetical protein
MAKAKDLKLDKNNGDFVWTTDGDLLVGDSDQDHVQSIIESYVGHWKEFPLVGVGIERYIKSPSKRLIDLQREIKIQMQGDGYRVGQILLNNGNFLIDADRI